jgi:DNA repair protein RecO (recombination protein O)
MRPAPVEREGIVVGRMDLGETDRIVRLLTPGDGRVSVVAHGARGARSRWTGLDIGTRARFASRPGRRDLETLAEVTVEDARLHLRSSLGRLALAAYACELCGSLAREGQPEPRLYGLLETALLVLDAADADPGEGFRAALEAKALTFAGVAPVLDRCVACGRAPTRDMVFSTAAGGLLHPGCTGDDVQGVAVTAEYAAALEAVRRAPLRDTLDLALPPGPPALLHEAIAAHLGRPLASRAVLDALLH